MAAVPVILLLGSVGWSSTSLPSSVFGSSCYHNPRVVSSFAFARFKDASPREIAGHLYGKEGIIQPVNHNKPPEGNARTHSDLVCHLFEALSQRTYTT